MQQPRSHDSDRHFRTEHLKADIKGRAARGGALTVASQGVKFVVQMGATVVLARLLTPADYGLIGMVAVVIGFVSIFKDMGLSAATIQKEEITPAQISTLFWVNVAVSAAVMLVTAALAPVIAWFYKEPRLALITVGYAAGFITGGLTVQHEALLRRQMRFAALAVLEIGGRRRNTRGNSAGLEGRRLLGSGREPAGARYRLRCGCVGRVWLVARQASTRCGRPLDARFRGEPNGLQHSQLLRRKPR
jgi:hypothetical protein